MLNRPGRDPGRARVDAGGRRRGARDRQLPGQPPEARGVGPRRPHARDQPARRRDRPRGGRREPLRGRLDRPDGAPARERRPDARAHHASASCDGLRGADARPRARAGRTSSSSRPRRTSSRSRPRSSAPARPSRPRARALPIQCSVSLLPQGGKMLLGTDISGRAHHADGARRRRDRAQLLHRPGGHARRDPLPRRAQPAAGALHPERRAAAPGARGRDDLPREAGSARGHAAGVRGALRRQRRRRLLRHHARAHRGDRGPRGRALCGAAPRQGPAAAVVDDDRHAAGSGAARPRSWASG